MCRSWGDGECPIRRWETASVPRKNREYRGGGAPLPVRLRRMRVSLKYKFFPLPGQACPEPAEGKGARGMIEGVPEHPASSGAGTYYEGGAKLT